ncbi:MAG: type II toxin-antitoxin system VapC family toxin [Dehalococcoidia bacterium]
MPESVFVDSAFLIGLTDARDSSRQIALELMDQLTRSRTNLTTSDAILIEYANYFSRGGNYRLTVAGFIDRIRDHAGWEIVTVSIGLVMRAESRYRRYTDKDWSMTDCISMELMLDRKLKRIATTDHGFEQAGFEVLMR